MPSLGRRNLFHDRVRLAVTLTGIVFAIILIAVQIGLFIGFATTTSSNIDHSNVDLWVAFKGVRYFDMGSPIPERKLYQVLATPGVAEAEKYIENFTQWKRPDGGREAVIVVGFNPDTGIGGPWDLAAGNAQDVKSADSVIIDKLYQGKLGVCCLDQVVEINGRRARIVGFTHGIRSFTTAPFVYTSFKNALDYSHPAIQGDETIYILVKAAAGVDVQTLKAQLAARISDVDIFTTAEFSNLTRRYWMFTTGAGITVLIAALMGFIVGVVVVAQTIYATTVDHLKEYGTLKAIGASNAYIYRVVIQQAVLSAVIGYIFGMGLTLVLVRLSQEADAVIRLPWQLGVGMFGIALVMCVTASIVSINKVTHLDPALVFRE